MTIKNGDMTALKADSLPKERKSESESGRLRTLKYKIKSKPLDVFYIMIHSRDKSPSKIKIKYTRIGDVIKEEEHLQDFKVNPKYKSVSIKIRDKETGEPVEANVIIKGIRVDDKLFLGSNFLFDAVPGRLIDITANSKGYFLEVNSIKYRSNQPTKIVVELTPLAPGKKMKLSGLRFQEDSKSFLPISKVALKRLLDFMVVNSDVKIEIQGHVNAPGYGSKRRVMRLSEERAKMAHDYLIKNGISSDRVSYKGFGNTQMVYPKPTTPAEEDVNRRVEIMIID